MKNVYRYSDKSVLLFRKERIVITTKVYCYSDKIVSLFRQKCIVIPTKVCRYSDKIFSYIVGITGFQKCRNSGTSRYSDMSE